MKRQIKQLTDRTFDLLVIGGGIYGATIAWEAVLRGLSVALIDQSDFGSKTSANSLKIVHGGLRYLQQLDVKRMRESIRERRTYLKIAPHLVHPLPCVMPTYGHMIKGPEVMRAGLMMNDIISADRNRLEDPEKMIPAGRILSRAECLAMVPGIESKRVNGAAFWTDAQIFNTERFNLSFILSAVNQGAEAANYIQAVDYLKRGNRVEGVTARDLISGEKLDIPAKMVVNAAGGWVNTLQPGQQEPHIQLSTAMNLVVNRKMLDGCAAGISTTFQYKTSAGNTEQSSRVLFMTPWRDVTVIGTYHKPYQNSPDAMKINRQEIDDFRNEINRGYPGDPVQRNEISYAYKGFLPMDGLHKKTGEVVLTKHYHIYDYKKDHIEGLITVSGVKYTTARDVAVKVVDRVFGKLGTNGSKSVSHQRRLMGGQIDNFSTFLKETVAAKPPSLSDKTMHHLAYTYGSMTRDILAYGMRDDEMLKLVDGSEEVIRAEIVHAVREEAAQTLSDVILRRTDMGSAGYPGDDILPACARLMGQELGWNKDKINHEISAVKQMYRVFMDE